MKFSIKPACEVKRSRQRVIVYLAKFGGGKNKDQRGLDAQEFFLGGHGNADSALIKLNRRDRNTNLANSV